MFCYQCEQTSKGAGCDKVGVCGKTPRTAVLQDVLFSAAKEIGWYATEASKKGARDRNVDRFVLEALFSTVTNVNFDDLRLQSLIDRARDLKTKTRGLSDGQKPYPAEILPPAGTPSNLEQLVQLEGQVSVGKQVERLGKDVAGLQELVTYGLKGMAAYAHHAMILGVEDDTVYDFINGTLAYLGENPESVEELTARALAVGEWNIKVMEMLDRANTDAYGHPEPTEVRVTPIKGKAILVSGHDLKDLELLLQQTEGKGINVYTHGEMLPAHGYPGLHKYTHLAGNYGGAWQDQQKEFEAFPGPILMTTNCIQKPRDSYRHRIFTAGLVAWPDVQHVSGGDFSKVVESAMAEKGFTEDDVDKKILTGFARNAVLGVADKVIDAVKQGQIRHFFLIGGCDGAKSGRNYYTDIAQKVPEDCVILTLACGKYRFNKLDFGDIGGIPRLLDIGQCNDAHSAIQIAVALAGAFETDVNGLPLSMILSWYEQKAVCILLSLLHLGIRNIRIGPSLPAFIGPNVLQVLVDNFNLMPISDPDSDLEAILNPES